MFDDTPSADPRFSHAKRLAYDAGHRAALQDAIRDLHHAARQQWLRSYATANDHPPDHPLWDLVRRDDAVQEALAALLEPTGRATWRR